MAAIKNTSVSKQDEHLLGEAKKIVIALGKMFAPTCEVLLHDLANPDHAVLAIENPLSGRNVGDSTTEMGLARIQDPDFPDVVQNYQNAFPDGRIVKSTSIGLRNKEGKFIAAICLNLDVSLFSSVQSVLEQLTATDGVGAPVEETLSTRTPNEVRKIIRTFSAKHNTQPRALSPQQRRELINQLSREGLLQLRGAATVIAEQLGISRASVYNALKD